jgi:hypothetical protein
VVLRVRRVRARPAATAFATIASTAARLSTPSAKSAVVVRRGSPAGGG